MNALTLLVDAANAESSSSTVKTGKATATDTIKDSTKGKNDMRSATITPEEKETSEDATTAAENRAMAQVLEARARESVLMQQMQQQHGAAAKMRYFEEMRKEEQKLLSKERLSVMMLQRERQQQEAAMHQATIMRIIGTAGSPSTATSAPTAPSPGMNTLQEAEYLQQLRLETLAQQRRQETLANLAMAPPGAPASKTLSKDVATHKYKRQDTALQKAILMARADEELRKQQLEHQQKAQEQIELEHQIELEKHRQQQAAVLQMMSNGDSNDAFVKALRAAAGSSGHGGSEESAILQLLEERERHRLLAQHQQNQHRPFLPQAVASSPGISVAPSASSMQLDLQNQLQQHLQARQQHHEAERSDLIGSVFAKVAAAAASANNNHHPGSPSSPSAQQQALPSQVLSAIAAAEEQEKQKLLQLQQHRQNSQESFQSSGMMIDALSHSQQQRQRLQQQALLNQQQQQQQQAAAMAQQQQESIQLNREMQQKQPSVEQDASFHDSKSTILPCRARGMPMDHNVKTAYFVIPQDIKHGTELLCSYFACRNAGIKFRYCVYCKLPVAKRNFAKRHRHSGKIPDSELSKDVVTVSTAEEPAPTCTLASLQKAPLEKPNPEEKETAGSAPMDMSVEVELSKASASTATPAIPSETTAITKDSSEKVVSPLCSDDCETPADRVEEASTHEAESSKPIQESDSITKECEANEAISTTDPSPVVLSPQPTIDTNKRRMEWEQLLLKRPKKAQHNSDAMMSWIKDVLRVSDFESEFVSDGSGMEDSDSGVRTDANPPLNGEKKRNIEEARPSSVKKSKKKALLSRKVQEDQEQNKFCDESQSANSNTESDSNHQLDEESAREVLAEKAPEKRSEDFSDDASTSSEESVDLRVRKKARN